MKILEDYKLENQTLNDKVTRLEKQSGQLMFKDFNDRPLYLIAMYIIDASRLQHKGQYFFKNGLVTIAEIMSYNVRF